MAAGEALKPPTDIRSFLRLLEEKGELAKIRQPLSVDLEVAEALRQVMEARGPAILFENVKGFKGWKLVGNIFGTLKRIKLALGAERLEDIGWRLVGFAWRPPPTTLVEKLAEAKTLIEHSKYMPKLVRRAHFTHTVYEDGKVDLEKIPFIRAWPRDGGYYLTFVQVYVRDPTTGATSIGVYRVMRKGRREVVVHWQMHKRGALAYREAFERDEPLPVAIVAGGCPAAMLAGVMPVPYPLDKLVFAGIMAGRGVEVYRLPNGILVPATAELVLEGYAEPGLVASEGPFGDHWGYYDRPIKPFPLVRVVRVWVRENPVIPVTVVGKPYMEDATIGKAVERVFLPILKTLLPEIVDVNLPAEGGFHGLAIVSIRKQYPGHAKKVMMALWGLGQMSLTKIIIVVDHDIDVHDLRQVIYAVAANVDPQRDVVIVPGTHTDELDPATPVPGYGSKLGIDATRKLPEEYMGRHWPEPVEPDPSVARRIRSLLKEVLGGVVGSGEAG